MEFCLTSASSSRRISRKTLGFKPPRRDRAIVRWFIISLSMSMIIKKAEEPRVGSSKRTCAATAPGDLPTILPAGSAKLIPAGSDLIFEMHYTPIGRAKVDRSKVGLILAKGPIQRRAYTHGIANRFIKIPPGESDHEEKAGFTFPTDSSLIALMPHMHLRGKSFKYVATYLDGKNRGPSLGPSIRLQLADLLPPCRAQSDAQRHAHRVLRPLRQLDRQPFQSRPFSHHPLGSANL